jgi:hypothetical protein
MDAGGDFLSATKRAEFEVVLARIVGVLTEEAAQDAPLDDLRRDLRAFFDSNPEVLERARDKLIRDALGFVGDRCEMLLSIKAKRPLSEDEITLAKELNNVLDALRTIA